MAISPRWKVYDSHGDYQAACKEIEAAAAVVSFYGDGATIRDGHAGIVWTEGKEVLAASESYDTVVGIVWERVQDRYNERNARWAKIAGGTR